MKTTPLLIILFYFTTCGLFAGPSEDEFEQRFRDVIEAEEMTPQALQKIWSFEETTTHYVIYDRIRESIKDAMLRGIEKIEIIDFSIPEGTPKNQLDGVSYDYRPTPSKLLSVTYVKRMEGTPFKWSWPLGEIDGKLYLVELSPRASPTQP
ncbi:hypothetical protein [Coraliomargarita parva]|uniref:hypothetical protein n=1 Tax=Coraliomargarita parva TaxID=3014050 RepID=UPI0022B44C42|nr:hypothetical protein [Coraliomargarita parva]